MESKIIKVGNSKGVIIPAKFLKLLGFVSKARIEIEDQKIVILPTHESPRQDWEKRFKKAEAPKETANLLPEVFEDELLEDWTW